MRGPSFAFDHQMPVEATWFMSRGKRLRGILAAWTTTRASQRLDDP
jgi:hypothetical protein